MRDARHCPGWLARLLTVMLLAVPFAATAQTDTSTTEVAAAPSDTAVDASADADDVVPEEPKYSEEDLDELVAPVALYPDPLLAQVLVAATYPVDVIKADRWVDGNKDMPAGERADAAEAEGWDPSVAVLAAGFPTVLDQMSGEVEWTENLGDAVLVQSDDVLDAVQRQRARANAVGNLETNEAQEVIVEEDNISIAPAQPEVVYVPTYDSQAVYTTPPAAAPVVVNSSDPGFSTGTLVTTGLLSFGAGMLVNEIFDDDDDDWHGYWGGPRYYGGRGYYGRGNGWMDWDDGRFRPRPGYRGGHNKVNIKTGDITINNNRLDIDRDGNWRPNDKRRDEARDKIGDRKRDRDRDGVRGDRNRERVGDRNRDRTRDRSRDDVRNKMAARSKDGGNNLQRKRDGDRKPAANRSDRKGSAFSGGADRGSDRGNLTSSKKAKNRGQASKSKAGISRPDSKASNRKATTRQASNRKANVGKPKTQAKPQRKASSKGGAFDKGGGGKSAKRANNRGKASRGKSRR